MIVSQTKIDPPPFEGESAAKSQMNEVKSANQQSLNLFIIVNDGVHKVHHRFGSAEYALHFVKPVVTLKETV